MTRARTVVMLLGMLLVGFLCTPAQAEELSGRRLNFAGFGTLAADYNNAADLQYRRSGGQPDVANGRKLDFATDSLFGLQLNAAWNHQLELVLQAVSRNSADQHWRPRLSRGFVRYLPDQSIMLRGGRIGFEFFPRADSSDVGYSFLTLRPPVEMFGQLSRLDFDGADVTVTRLLGRGLGRIKLFGGDTSGTVVYADGTRVDLDGSRIWGVQGEYSQGPWAAQLGVSWYLVGHMPSLAALSAGLRQTGEPQAQHLARQFDGRGRRTTLTSAALTYDETPWQGRLYLVRTDTGSPIGPKLNIGMATLGYGLGKFTPYGLLSRVYNYADIQPTGLADTPQNAELNAGAHAAQTQSQTNQSTVAAGLRWDFAPKMDLKLQIDHVWTQGSTLVFDRRTPAREDAELTVFGLALDFVF